MRGRFVKEKEVIEAIQRAVRFLLAPCPNADAVARLLVSPQARVLGADRW
jgi:hypothetical protein